MPAKFPRQSYPVNAFRRAVLLACLLFVVSQASGQATPRASSSTDSSGDFAAQAPPRSQAAELQQAIGLTRTAKFAEALPMWRALADEGNHSYLVIFNLSLCEVALGQNADAVLHLQALQNKGQNTAAMNNLLAQAYLGEHQVEPAWAAVQAAARMSPQDDKMYAYLLDACADHYEFALGLRIANLALGSLPASQRLHYERATFLLRLDRLDQAGPEFAKAIALNPETDLGYLAQVQSLLSDNDLPQALLVARRAVAAGHRDYEMLSLLGTVLLYTGVSPGQAEFKEAQLALEASVEQRPDYSTAQIALGKLYLMEGRAADAVIHLEIGRRREPRNPACYPALAQAYRRLGDKAAAAASLQTLASLLQEKGSVALSGGK